MQLVKQSGALLKSELIMSFDDFRWNNLKTLLERKMNELEEKHG